MVDTRDAPRTGLDFYPTPPSATRMFLDALAADVQAGGGRPFDQCGAFEVACGEGHISEVLQEFFWGVWSSDIHDYGYGMGRGHGTSGPLDFCNPMERSRLKNLVARECRAGRDNKWLITNPPFTRASEFIDGAMDLGFVNIAILARLQFLEGAARMENLYSVRPPTDVYVYSRRVPFMKGKVSPSESSSKMAFAWYVWRDSAPAGETRLKWLSGRYEDYEAKRPLAG